jgi:hypothetical protein
MVRLMRNHRGLPRNRLGGSRPPSAEIVLGDVDRSWARGVAAAQRTDRRRPPWRGAVSLERRRRRSRELLTLAPRSARRPRSPIARPFGDWRCCADRSASFEAIRKGRAGGGTNGGEVPARDRGASPPVPRDRRCRETAARRRRRSRHRD